VVSKVRNGFFGRQGTVEMPHSSDDNGSERTI
jgi:hypothetical protein